MNADPAGPSQPSFGERWIPSCSIASEQIRFWVFLPSLRNEDDLLSHGLCEWVVAVGNAKARPTPARMLRSSVCCHQDRKPRFEVVGKSP
jgi:hypothetical protein